MTDVVGLERNYDQHTIQYIHVSHSCSAIIVFVGLSQARPKYGGVQ